MRGATSSVRASGPARVNGEEREARTYLLGVRSLAVILLGLGFFVPSSGQAQTSLVAREGALEHRLFIAGAIGVYFRGGVDPATTDVGCVVRLSGEADVTMSIALDLLLPGGPCVAASLPHITSLTATPIAFRAGRRRLPTENATYLQVPFPDEPAAWRAASSIATVYDDCTHASPSANWVNLECDSGLLIGASSSAGRGARPAVALQFVHGPRLYGHCDAFVDEVGFTESSIDDTTIVCTRTGRLDARTTRAEVEAALGPCTSTAEALTCGTLVVSLGSEGHPTSVRRTR